MSSITENKNRIGNFTSSEIVKLMSNGRKAGEPGAPFKDYIEEKNFERKLCRSIDSESNAHPLTWGKVNENRVFELLGIRYKECSQESLIHPEYPFWAGSPDGLKTENEILTIAEVKCPQTLKSFCQLVDCIPMVLKDGIYEVDTTIEGHEIIAAIRENHKDGDKYYWQCISNAVLTGARFAELIIYCPYYGELNEIRALAQKKFDEGESAYWWIAKGSDSELPYLLESGQYNNLNIIRWQVSELDRNALTERVIAAGKLLITD